MNQFGMHDEEGCHLPPAGGICVALCALSENPVGKNYTAMRSDINWFLRANWGYGSTGTIPLPQDYSKYINNLIKYVSESKGISHVIIGNEPNHEQERPDGQVITPSSYALLYNDTYHHLKKRFPDLQIGPAGFAPYHANPQTWTSYSEETLSMLVDADFLTCHAYIRGYTPEAVVSNNHMGYPLQGQSNSFRTYRDFLWTVPDKFKNLPVHITECNELEEEGWYNRNTGVVEAVYQEISDWNAQAGVQKIHSVTLYRWPKHDKWYIEGKQGVIEDYQDAIRNSSQNDTEGQGEAFEHKVVLPIIEKGETQPGSSVAFERDIDSMAIARGVVLIPLAPEDSGWRVKKIDWLNVIESQGRHHIYYDTLDENGNRLVGVKIRVQWSTGFTTVESEEKPGEPYSANYPMSSSRNDYSTWVGDGKSEVVGGIGMGSDEGDGFNASNHTCTVIIYQRTGPLTVQVKPEEPKPVRGIPQIPYPVDKAVVTQEFGEHPENYSKFGIPGHNGVDFAVPLETPVYAVYGGKVMEVKRDPKGFGLYMKLRHTWGETIYAHLNLYLYAEGSEVSQGDEIALSGSTGYSSGPHLHFGLRPYPLDLSNGYNGYVDPLPYFEEEAIVVEGTEGYSAILKVIKEVAKEYGMDWKFLAALAWAESSFRPELDDGLFQIGDLTWGEFAPKVRARNINNVRDNTRVAAEYYQYLLKVFGGNELKALQAWNFGIGNMLDKKPVPAITNEHVNKIRYGRDLLTAIGV